MLSATHSVNIEHPNDVGNDVAIKDAVSSDPNALLLITFNSAADQFVQISGYLNHW